MTFPLAQWIEGHEDVPHHLGRSGMVGSLTTTPAVIASSGPGEEAELRRRLARRMGVAPERLFLTTGATEANFDALVYLLRESNRRIARAPRVRTPVPEYPPLWETAAAIGFRRVGPTDPAEVTVCSQPNNPCGTRAGEGGLDRIRKGAATLVVDETFREFTAAPSLARAGGRGVWVTGSFTKVYGADPVRVGYVVAPPEEAARFGAFAEYAMHEIATASVGAALAILDHRRDILRESRGLFRQNLSALRHRVRGVPALAAPVWFDRGDGVLPGDTLARRALDSGVLVCSGSFFGDATGVRVTLTRRSFPDDLQAYLSVRDLFL
ncbi:MAG: aminotransferase class I/II-fold pyridoxal phosphate-dependent enzyme [Thermoplasmata archaeon]|nr:aminotransferase class I/II-fold pyridoxal phosphate-dependent enzyme [Thermoplasmata archaeon]